MSRQIAAVLAVAMLLLAGCAWVPGGGGGGGQTESGTMQFYISDQQNAIDDFRHLNATVTKIGLHRVGNNTTEGEWVTYNVSNVTLDLTQLQGKNATQIANVSVPNGTYNKVFVHVSSVEGTLKSGEQADVSLPSNKLHVNENFTVGSGEQFNFVYDISVVKAGGSGKYVIKPVVSESGKNKEVRRTDARVSPPKQGTQTGQMAFYLSDEQNAMDQFRHLNVTVTKVGFHKVGQNSSEGRWVEYNVSNRTVDLTELQGKNATKIADLQVPNGTYDKVFVYVGQVDGTLKTGESVNVKLPSSKLHINTQFTVGAGENAHFVYDMSVFKAGGSGKYILKPVVSESGKNKAVNPVGLDANFVGEVAAGQNATVKVTSQGSPVEGATVVYRETTYTTNADGTVTFQIPSDATKVKVKIKHADRQTELERELGTTTQTATATSTPTETATATATSTPTTTTSG